MAIGPGKYDDECTRVRESTDAEAVALIVLGGTKGSGFSVQGPLHVHSALPGMLRLMAATISTLQRELDRARAALEAAKAPRRGRRPAQGRTS